MRRRAGSSSFTKTMWMAETMTARSGQGGRCRDSDLVRRKRHNCKIGLSCPAKAGHPVIIVWRLLDRPPEPVIGPAKGRTRWRAMTAEAKRCPRALTKTVRDCRGTIRQKRDGRPEDIPSERPEFLANGVRPA